MLEPDLLVTKFTIPPVRSGLLQRSHLLTILNQNCSVPLTLLSASAGFGKTTLLSAWTRQSTSQVAWVTLDDQDNDPARFWAYVIAALRKAGSSVGEATLAMLHAPQPAQLSMALTALINELAELAQDTALILDDYHLIRETAIHESLQFMLEHRPACVRLLLASRSDPQLPLARLRVRGQVAEIREADLRLRGEEVVGFLTRVMHLSLSAEEMGRLETRTEGWIAGLQLAALSLQRHDDVPAFLQTFTGSQRLIQDYMHEEIIEPLPKDQQRFLLYTSVLERMNAGICQALTSEQDSQAILEKMERDNLFLVPLDEERHWYRFHTLFREVLLARLQAIQPDQVVRLHREAALWYQQQGWPHESISHALASRDFWFVAELLENCVEHLGLQGELKTLLAWIKQLPQEVLRTHPRLATSYILIFNVLFPFSPQEQGERIYLQQLQEGVEVLLQSEDQTILSRQEYGLLYDRIMVLKAWNLVAAALSDGHVTQLNRLAEQFQYIKQDDDTMWQQLRLAPFCISWHMAGNFSPMVAALQESRKKTWMTQNRYQEAQILWGLIAALIGLGRLQQAQDRCQELQQLVSSLGVPAPLAAYPNLFRAQLAYAWNQLESAKSEALLAIEKTAPLQYLDILMGAYMVLGRCCIAQSDLIGAEHAIREMERVNRAANIPLFRPWIEGLQVHLWLAQGELKSAENWAEHAIYSQDALSYSSESAYLALVRVYLADLQYPQALQWLTALLSSAEQVAGIGSVISILALQVVALQESGATQEVPRVLHRLLTLAEPEGCLRVFLDAGEPMQRALEMFLNASHIRVAGSSVSPALISYAFTVHASFAGDVQRQMISSVSKKTPFPLSSQAASPLIEPLTPRELEVLSLLAEGTSNQGIAMQLVVSLATAKKHVASILSKLGAENRTQAIALARSLALL